MRALAFAAPMPPTERREEAEIHIHGLVGPCILGPRAGDMTQHSAERRGRRRRLRLARGEAPGQQADGCALDIALDAR